MMDQRQTLAIEAIDQAMVELGELLATPSSGDRNIAYERLRRWKTRSVASLEQTVHPEEGSRLSKKRLGAIRMGDPWGNFREECLVYKGFLVGLRDELLKHPESVLNAPPPPTPASAPSTAGAPSSLHSVFIVHGHDELNLLRLKELLRDRWHLPTVVMSGAPGKGRTLIEKFEEEAAQCTFAFVLITPDDLISAENGEYAQARPNVVFELGWFYGRLTRSRVCILFRRGTRIHSDLDGVSRIEFDKSIAEKLVEIERELTEAGVLPHSQRRCLTRHAADSLRSPLMPRLGRNRWGRSSGRDSQSAVIGCALRE